MLITLLTRFSHTFNLLGIGQQVFYCNRVFILNSQKIVSKVLSSCFRCRRCREILQSDQVSHHCVALKPPFTRLSLDLFGAFTVKATQTSHALVKLWLLDTVCLSAVLLCHQVLDNISYPSVVQALWTLQMKHGCLINHIHSDAVSQFHLEV